MKSLRIRDLQPPTMKLRWVTKNKWFLQLRTFVLLYQVMDSRRPIQSNNKMEKSFSQSTSQITH
jgi:hypothetical protein